MEHLKRSRRGKKKYRPANKKRLTVWGLTVLVSLIFIAGSFHYFKDKVNVFNVEDAYTERGIVTEIGERIEDSYATGEDSSYNSARRYFDAKMTSGRLKGQTVLAVQSFDNLGPVNDREVKPGDKVILFNYGMSESGADWIFGGYSRLDAMIVSAVIFGISLLIFGRIKGLNTVVALVFTVLAVFVVFIPAVLAAGNIYLWTFIICLYIIPMTLLITEGATKKALTATLGCASGVAMAALLCLIFDRIMELTGMLDEHSIYLIFFDPPIDLNGLIFAMVVIGAMGAVMDVAMDISSSLHELHVKLPELSFRELWRSGITIGRDIMGTMANTLVLAYIGSSLCSILLMITYSSNLRELLNRESIIVEIMNGLIGSCAILLTIPLTTLICGIIYTHEKNN